jgi:hypothetical protein
MRPLTRPGSVDYALALETLPSSEDSARWLAVWGVAGFIGAPARRPAVRSSTRPLLASLACNTGLARVAAGTTVGPLLSGPVLFLWPGASIIPGTSVRRNPTPAYQAVLIIGAGWMSLSCLFLRRIRVKRPAAAGGGRLEEGEEAREDERQQLTTAAAGDEQAGSG